MVDLNSWSTLLRGAMEGQGVGLTQDPAKKSDVPKGNLGGHQVTLVPLDNVDNLQNAEAREKLFQALKKDVGQSKTELEFIEKTRQDLGLDTSGKANGDVKLKALKARDIVNVGRAQNKNATAMVNKALDAVVDRVPPNALQAIKRTILQQANHPDVVAFLDKYGSGGRDLELLQRVCDLALQTANPDRMTRAYLTGFRGDVRATAAPVKSLDEMNVEDQAAADLETQQKSDGKKPKSTEAPGGIPQSKTKTGPISRGKVFDLGGGDKAREKSKTGPISRDKVLGGEQPKPKTGPGNSNKVLDGIPQSKTKTGPISRDKVLVDNPPKKPDVIDMKKLCDRWTTIGGNYNTTKASFEKQLVDADKTKNQLGELGQPFTFGKSGEFKLTLRGNSGEGNNCFFFSALCGMKKSGGNGGKDVSVTLQEAMQFRQQLNEHVENRLAQLDKLKGVRYETSEHNDVNNDHLFVETPWGEEKERSVQSAVVQHLDGEFLNTDIAKFKGADLGTAAFLADMLGKPVVVYAEVAGVQNVTMYDTNLETGVQLKGEPLRLYYSKGNLEGSSTGHFQFVDKVEDVPMKERKQEVKIGYETVKALGLGDASPELQAHAASRIASMIESRVRDSNGTTDQVDAVKQEIDKRLAAKCGAQFQKFFQGVKNEHSFTVLWDEMNKKGSQFLNVRDAVLDELGYEQKYSAFISRA